MNPYIIEYFVLSCAFELPFSVYVVHSLELLKPGFHIIARSRKESQRVAIKVIKFACDSLRSYGNRLKICLRLLATPCDRCRKQSQR